LSQRPTLIAFVPVIHQGYLNLFEKYKFGELGILGPRYYGKLEQLTREIRAVKPERIRRMVQAEGIFSRVFVINDGSQLDFPNTAHLVMPDEDISHVVAKEFLSQHEIQFDNEHLLRFDMPKSLSQNPVIIHRTLSATAFDREMMDHAYRAIKRSPDWWRQVAAVSVKDGNVLFIAHNTHMPNSYTLYALGDPRGNFKPGEHLEITAARHAEKAIIAMAARIGVSLEGSYIYVTTFPCPPCAFDIAGAGIKRVYFSEGYSAVTAQDTFDSEGVELIHVPQIKNS
jgi:dCMP deaminase